MATASNNNRNWEPPKLDLSVDRYNAFKAWHDRVQEEAECFNDFFRDKVVEQEL